MLADFIAENRDVLIASTRKRVAERTSPRPTPVELTNGIPMFLDQLGAALQLARASDVVDHDEIARTARAHGRDLLRLGLTIGQVVQDYGDVCQAVTELAVTRDLSIASSEFRTLNLCLDDAIAGAVTEYAQQRERAASERGTERIGFLAHELRNLLNSAVLAFESIRRGQVSVNGSTAIVLRRSLLGLKNLIDRSLADVRLDIGIGSDRRELISVADLLGELETRPCCRRGHAKSGSTWPLSSAAS